MEKEFLVAKLCSLKIEHFLNEDSVLHKVDYSINCSWPFYFDARLSYLGIRMQ